MSKHFNRRQVMATGLGLLSTSAIPARAGGESRALRVAERAGLRRFGYPVHARLSGVEGDRPCRLLLAGKPVPAQFRTIRDAGGASLAIDFNASPGPLETQRYTVEFGTEGPAPAPGLRVEQDDVTTRVVHGSALSFEVPNDLSSLLKSVVAGPLSYVSEGVGGLGLFDRENRLITVSAEGRPEITRQGPLAVGLRFRGNAPEAGATVIDMTFPRGKSWVEVDWRVNDSEARFKGLAVALPLVVEGAPTLIDLGASSTVYGQIRGQESMTMEARPIVGALDRTPPWTILSGPPPDRGAPFAVAPPGDRRAAEGWAHVMDRRRCTAVGIADFGRFGFDRLGARADGRLTLYRELSGAGPKPAGGLGLKFWLHFVPMPVQVGAATSPQAMLSPLEVAWE